MINILLIFVYLTIALMRVNIFRNFREKSVSYNLNIAFIGYRKIHLREIMSSWHSALRLNCSSIYDKWVGETVSKLLQLG